MKSGRQVVVFLLLVGFALVLTWRLYYWQVLSHDKLSAMADAEHVRDEEIPANRGAILDASGNVLVTNEAVDSVYASKKQIKDPANAAEVLSPLLQMPRDDLLKRLTDPQGQFIRLKLWVTPDVSQAIKNTKLAGIFLEPTTRRTYPQGTLAAQLLGFVNADGAGQYGLEESYNQVLAGRPGHLKAETDAAGNPINFSTPKDSLPAQDGASLVTSIDSSVQYIAEQELAAAVQKHRATGGTILIMDPRNGEIIADANLPSFNPADYATT